MATVRPLQEKMGWAYGTAVHVLRPPFRIVMKQDWVDGERIPASGGCIVVVNHISPLDPLTLAHFLFDHGRLVRYLAKDGLFRVPVIGTIVRDAKQIPVSRLTTDAAKAFDAAVTAVDSGELIGVYPEGTITRDPDGWPMRGKTGAARIALATGAPVVPIGQWGAQQIVPPYSKRISLLPRHTVHYRVGEPVDLDDLRGTSPSNEVLAQATDRIMAAITALVEEIRGEQAPSTRFDPRAAGVRQIGNYKKSAQNEAAQNKAAQKKPARKKSAP